MNAEDSLPPLLGDGHGKYRVHIVGNSGSGKSTTATALAKILNLPCISMDRIMWQPGWVQTPTEEFQAKLRKQLDQASGSWIVEGNYESMGGLMALEESTDVIWLDPPLMLYFPRLILRTFMRLFRLKEPCSPGCFEKPSEVFFSKDSIIWWCISHHWTMKRRCKARMEKIGIETGSDVERRRMRRLGGWGSSVKRWLFDVETMVQSKNSESRKAI
ncbi:hypothetical protein CPC08DRAFT_714990 [Agrocybe pediades]|nr:hypothetical protein CPC08DRAFT_714990 [Agrocybe pediades]